MNPQHAALIWKLTRDLRSGARTEQITADALTALTEALGCEESSLWLLNVRDSRLYIVASVGSQDRLGAFLDLDQGLPGAVSRSGNPLLISDPARDPRFAGAGRIPRNIFVIPLKTPYECLGCIQMTNKREGDFSQDDYQMGLLGASLIALALEERGLMAPPSERLNQMISLKELEIPAAVQDESDAILGPLNLNIYEGEWLAVLGERGCGSRNLHQLLELAFPPEKSRGRFTVMGRDALSFTEEERDDYRRGILGVLEAQPPLVPTMTVKGNVEIASRQVLEPMDTEAALELAGLKGMGGRLPGSLNPLEKRRVGLARLLAKKSLLILAEEPGSGLSLAEQNIYLEALRKTAKQLGASVILFTAQRQRADLADRILTMTGGRFGSLYINRHPVQTAPAEKKSYKKGSKGT